MIRSKYTLLTWVLYSNSIVLYLNSSVALRRTLFISNLMQFWVFAWSKSFVVAVPWYCQQAPKRGRCDEYIQNYFYNTETNQCELFIYTGCGGNANRFPTKERCEEDCLLLPPSKKDPKVEKPEPSPGGGLQIVPSNWYSFLLHISW